MPKETRTQTLARLKSAGTKSEEEAETPAEESAESPAEQSAEAAEGAEGAIEGGGGNDPSESPVQTEAEAEPTDEEKTAAVAHYRRYKPLTDSIEAAGGPDAFEKYKSDAAGRAHESEQARQEEEESGRRGAISNFVQDHVNAGHIHPDLAPGFEESLQGYAKLKPIQDEMERRNFDTEKGKTVAALKGQYPHMDEDAVHEAIDGGGDIMGTAQRTHNHVATALASAMKDQSDGVRADANAERKTRATGAPTPQGAGGGGPMPPKSMPKAGTPEFAAFKKAMVSKAEDARYGS